MFVFCLKPCRNSFSNADYVIKKIQIRSKKFLSICSLVRIKSYDFRKFSFSSPNNYYLISSLLYRWDSCKNFNGKGMNEFSEAEAVVVRSSMTYLNKLVINSHEWMGKRARERKRKNIKIFNRRVQREARELMKLLKLKANYRATVEYFECNVSAISSFIIF